MKRKYDNLLDYFRLKPIKAAKISEISETTASSSVPPEERVNFHIGNPVQDIRLYSAYLRMALGIDIQREDLNENTKDKILTELGWGENERPNLDFFNDLIKNSSPYLPRGGYPKENPTFIAKHLHEWLLKDEQEPLLYDLGNSGAQREVILCSGGVNETLRVFFHSLANYLEHLPAKILLYGVNLPEHLLSFHGLVYETLPEDENLLIQQIINNAEKEPDIPSFVILGKIPGEETRRTLRQLGMDYPLFFVEINNAPNHLSLAREAKLMNIVLRFLTPGIFSPVLNNFSIVFSCGNSQYLNVMETVHFQLKGTPSASEVELLTYILKQDLIKNIVLNTHASSRNGMEPDIPYYPNNTFLTGDETSNAIISDPVYEDESNILETQRSLKNQVLNYEERINKIARPLTELAEKKIRFFSNKIENIISKIENDHPNFSYDMLSGKDVYSLFNDFIHNLNSKKWNSDLISAFRHVFLKYHTEYDPKDCFVISGSARTALGFIGFHCGITEVVVPDLSWTYEHCFPKVYRVSLTKEYELDVPDIIKTVEENIKSKPGWDKIGAVVINNPHNATGKIFREEDVKSLIKWLLRHRIFIIDDLSYQNVAPEKKPVIIKTIKQLALELMHDGFINEEHIKYVVTVHALSKTDCLAGARLAVAEIKENNLKEKFGKINTTIIPNISAVLLTYLFYRNRAENINAYFRLRNTIFYERMSAIEEAVNKMPASRNSFGIDIIRPQGSMYPRMVFNYLPPGLSLDWLASNLARQGIGLVPLSTFARTGNGFEIARKSFRLTLGGGDNAAAILKKTRRILIDINRLVAEESANYNIHKFNIKNSKSKNNFNTGAYKQKWDEAEKRIHEYFKRINPKQFGLPSDRLNNEFYYKKFTTEYLFIRLEQFRKIFYDNILIREEISKSRNSIKPAVIIERLETEFMKDNLLRREEEFNTRLYDRTVHPTQMYSLKAEIAMRNIMKNLIHNSDINKEFVDDAAYELMREYFGITVPITSSEESEELLLDLNSVITAEYYSEFFSDSPLSAFLSFWGDWDGSTRPSGQGHRLISTVVIENVVHESRFIKLLLKNNKSLKIDPEVLKQIENLTEKNKRFRNLQDEITLLTHQLERRYHGVLPFGLKPGKLRRLGMNLKLAKDPTTSLWMHNDRLERKMIQLREKRKSSLEYYFSLNKKLRKTLFSLIPAIEKSLNNDEIFIEANLYKDLLRRFVVTPRIHQNLITAQDQFAIDTTIHNIHEINEIASKYGNPGMILALQVSMSTKPDALILLDRKIKAKREQILRENPEKDLPYVSAIPLFEDPESVKEIRNYLLQSRKLNQETSERFNEIITEVFIAGSDLSQQVGHAAGLKLFKEAKLDIITWLSEKGLVDRVRVKMGSGETMQRQGCYYSSVSGKKAFIRSDKSAKIFSRCLEEAGKKSVEYAVTPLMGVFFSGDLKTFQSSLSEQLRYLSANQLSELLYHVRESQKFLKDKLLRASNPLTETRLQFTSHGLKELERLSLGKKDKIYDDFITILIDNFRHILYGREEDVVGIHIISYFIARTMPTLRDRPTVRPAKGSDGDTGQRILEKIAETIPFSRYGSRLRAIAHNQAQTMVLGINQLTSGLFRSLDVFSQRKFAEGDPMPLIMERILPNLPVYEILHTLRIYHDPDLTYLDKIEKAFPAGNSAFIVLREDIDSMKKYIPLFKKELLRRHGLSVGNFFEGDEFIPDLLPTLRPDLAVLLQPDLFNTEIKNLDPLINGNADEEWYKEMKALVWIPHRIQFWRKKSWELLEKPIYQRVESFVELALALHSISAGEEKKEFIQSQRKNVFSAELKNYYKSVKDDAMQQYIAAAYEYLSSLSQNMLEVPINIIRALKEVERIMTIEEQALLGRDQNLLRFYLLQMARIAGENG
jgi:aspartate/methionine/tyrosine aminotransferase